MKERLDNLIHTNNLVFCYLDRVYTDSADKSLLYQITLADNDFLNVYISAIDLSTLMLLLECKLTCDFAVKNDMLFAKDVDRVLLVDTLWEKRNIFIPVYDLEEQNFYTFLRYGIKHDFLVLEDEAAELSAYRGTAFSSFRNIKFSSTSMTAYAPIYNGNNLYNKMLVVMDDGVLQLEHFIFAVPTACKEDMSSFDCYGTILINNTEYTKYSSKLMNIYTENYSTSKALINKACVSHEKYKAAIDTLNDLRQAIAEDIATYHWVGGNNSYNSSYGIYLQCSEKKLSSKVRANLITKVQEEYLPIEDYNTAVNTIMNSSMNLLAKAAAISLYACYDNSSDEATLLQNIATLIESFKRRLTFADLFLYSVRTGAYIRKRYLVNPIKPILVGSEEECTTIVQQQFKRG